MKPPGDRRAHEGARPTWRPSPAWLWMLASRRQFHQEITTVLSEFDATERCITELYAKAVEKLGSNKARVRRGGLYALERLAQDNPAHRQTIVNVICAYLRMPFFPTAPTGRPEHEAAEGQKDFGSETEARTFRIGDIWQPERQVRLTAQRILEKHVRDGRDEDQQSTGPPASRFWPNIRLNLTGATLINFNLVNGVMADANFHEAVFSGGARFDEAIFRGDARFDGATFSGSANFYEAVFSGDAWFGEATFRGDAGFNGAAFRGDARFDKAAFHRCAWFRRAAFSGDAWFDKAAVHRSARFRGAVFSGDAWFGEATFTGDAQFDGATFSHTAWFGQAAFSGGAGFSRTTFGGHAGLDGATFSRDEDSLSFQRSRVLSPDGKHVWPTGWRLMPDSRSGFTVVRAKDDDLA
jgi:uncharacterized protein YjbI with pentapeptide repeats